MYNACSNYYHRVQKLKLLIKEQTDLDPHYQELFYENLPYKPGQAEVAAKLPTTTVSWLDYITLYMCIAIDRIWPEGILVLTIMYFCICTPYRDA